VGADLIVNTDTHMPEDLINCEMASKIALGAGLPRKDLKTVLWNNPLRILKNKGIL
jgi:histidinol phosphatase-like PHP family hydrolase